MIRSAVATPCSGEGRVCVVVEGAVGNIVPDPAKASSGTVDIMCIIETHDDGVGSRCTTRTPSANDDIVAIAAIIFAVIFHVTLRQREAACRSGSAANYLEEVHMLSAERTVYVVELVVSHHDIRTAPIEKVSTTPTTIVVFKPVAIAINIKTGRIITVVGKYDHVVAHYVVRTRAPLAVDDPKHRSIAIVVVNDIVARCAIARNAGTRKSKVANRDIASARNIHGAVNCHRIAWISSERNPISRTARRRLRPSTVCSDVDIACISRYCGIGTGLDGGVGLARSHLPVPLQRWRSKDTRARLSKDYLPRSCHRSWFAG